MNYKILGPRVLVKVKNYSFSKEETFEGTCIVMPEMQKEQETTWQTKGEVVQLGPTAYKRNDSFCDGTDWVKVGDIVHFNRYGNIRANASDKNAEYEYWVVMDKDILYIEEKETI